MDLSAAVASYLAASGWVISSISEPEQVGQGWESTIHAFTLMFPEEPDRDIVLRRYAGSDGADKAVREYQGMRALHESGYPVPEVLAVQSDPDELGAPFLLMERVGGNPMWRQIFADDGTVDAGLLDVFVELAVRLHRVDSGPFPAEPMPVAGQLDEWRAAVTRFPIPGFDAAMVWLDDHVASVVPVDPAVVHWDFHPENVLYGSGGTVHVVDWTQIGVTDPRFDLAWTMLLVGAGEGRQWRGAILERYEDMSGVTLPSLEFFDAAVALKRLYSVTAALLAGPEALGMQAEAAASMQRHLGQLVPVYELFREGTGLAIPAVEELLGDQPAR